MIRQLHADEIVGLRGLGRAFFAEGRLPGAFRYPVFADSWRRLLGSGLGAIFAYWPEGDQYGEEPAGALGAAVYPDPNDGELVATEFFWFVMPDRRGGPAALRLLRAYETWAQSVGARRLIMVHLAALRADDLKRVYERMGYREVETHYIKEVS